MAGWGVAAKGRPTLGFRRRPLEQMMFAAGLEGDQRQHPSFIPLFRPRTTRVATCLYCTTHENNVKRNGQLHRRGAERCGGVSSSATPPPLLRRTTREGRAARGDGSATRTPVGADGRAGSAVVSGEWPQQGERFGGSRSRWTTTRSTLLNLPSRRWNHARGVPNGRGA